MFGIFLSNKMDPFYQILLSFPTVVFTVLLLFVIFYWALAVLGLVELDVLDFALPGIDVDPSALGDSMSNLNVMSGVMLKLGLNGVPVTIIATFIVLVGWLLSFTATFFLYPLVPDGLIEFLLGIPLLLGVSYAAAWVSAWLIKPLRPLFLTGQQDIQTRVLGQTAIVRTGVVDAGFGEAVLEDGGAGLILKVRAFNDETFNRGERVVLLEYVAADNTYLVVSQAEFTA